MNLLRRIARRLSAMTELEASHTAIVLHWPDNSSIDVTFVLRGIVDGEPLHRCVDALLEEHAPATDGSLEVVTEVSIFWHHPDGAWDMEEFLSHYYATEPPATA